MMHRTLPALNLPKSPLEFVIGQARFEPILTIEKSIPEIQNRLRLSGFTNYEERMIEIERQMMGQPGPIEKTRFKQWVLTDGKKQRSFTVDREGITFQTTTYTKFENFLEVLKLGLDSLGEHAAPQEARRIGLRYIDAISPAEGRPLEWYVNPKLLGPILTDFGTRVGQSTESVVRTGEKRRLKIKYVEAVKGLGLPIDILPIQLQLKSPLRRVSPFAVLDTDHSDSNISEFSVTNVIARISGLHDTLDQVFRQLVTQDAINYWSKP
jgi:uncharacterized protein (TIGR04255 family)